MTVVNFSTARAPDFHTILAHLRAAADMVRGMDKSQLDDFWAQAQLHAGEADDDDLSASLAMHLSDWECDVRDEWQTRNSGSVA